MTDAACATSGFPPETWNEYIHGEGPKDRRRRIADAIAVCRSCPVVEACGDLADQRYDIGVWGGRLRHHQRMPIIDIAA